MTPNNKYKCHTCTGSSLLTFVVCSGSTLELSGTSTGDFCLEIGDGRGCEMGGGCDSGYLVDGSIISILFDGPWVGVPDPDGISTFIGASDAGRSGGGKGKASSGLN